MYEQMGSYGTWVIWERLAALFVCMHYFIAPIRTLDDLLVSCKFTFKFISLRTQSPGWIGSRAANINYVGSPACSTQLDNYVCTTPHPSNSKCSFNEIWAKLINN